MTLHEFLQKLHNVKPSGAGYVASCPAHHDAHPSLSVSRGDDGKIVLHCHAGCEPETIVNALGLTMQDLFPRAELKTDSRVVATYDYRDERDALLYQILRFSDKTFKARRPDGAGKWAWNLQDTRRVLYQLPDLLTRPDEIVFVVEGEKDVDNLKRIGLLATTNVFGAEKWLDSYSEILRGRNVVIVPDNDDKGRAHAAQVARSVYPLAASVKILELPNLPKEGDVSDWLHAGGDKETLIALAEETKLYAPGQQQDEKQISQPIRVLTLKDIRNMKRTEPNWIIKNLLPEGLAIFAGAPKIGKSWLALQIAKAIASGEDVLNEQTKPGAILYLALEDGAGRIDERTTIQQWRDDLDADFLTIGMFESEIHDFRNGGRERLERMIEQRGYRLIVIDTLSRAIRGDQDKVRDMTRDLAPFQEIAHKHNCACVLIHHTRKPLKDRSTDDYVSEVMGSRAIAAMADTVWVLSRERNKATARLAVTGRDIEERNLILSMDWERGLWSVERDADAVTLTEREKEILDVLKRGKARLAEIANATGQDKSNQLGRLEKLTRMGLAKREGDYYMLTTPTTTTT